MSNIDVLFVVFFHEWSSIVMWHTTGLCVCVFVCCVLVNCINGATYWRGFYGLSQLFVIDFVQNYWCCVSTVRKPRDRLVCSDSDQSSRSTYWSIYWSVFWRTYWSQTDSEIWHRLFVCWCCQHVYWALIETSTYWSGSINWWPLF